MEANYSLVLGVAGVRHVSERYGYFERRSAVNPKFEIAAIKAQSSPVPPFQWEVALLEIDIEVSFQI